MTSVQKETEKRLGLLKGRTAEKEKEKKSRIIPILEPLYRAVHNSNKSLITSLNTRLEEAE